MAELRSTPTHRHQKQQRPIHSRNTAEPSLTRPVSVRSPQLLDKNETHSVHTVAQFTIADRKREQGKQATNR
jgi:hypothetical protein